MTTKSDHIRLLFSEGKTDTAEIAEFWFSTASQIDFSDANNRAKFARNGRPAYLGTDGSKPTGSQPLIYMKGAASAWATNYGSGGNFTVNGALANAATPPSY